MEKQTVNSKNFNENNYIVITYTPIDNFNKEIKIIYLLILISVIILTYLNYISSYSIYTFTIISI